MAVDNTEQLSLTFTAEMEALRVPKELRIWSEAGGQVSGLELMVFRDAIAGRVRARTIEEPDPGAKPAESYEPAASLPEETRQKLVKAHGIGVTVADILLDEEAFRRKA
jgi:hypothetical protein